MGWSGTLDGRDGFEAADFGINYLNYYEYVIYFQFGMEFLPCVAVDIPPECSFFVCVVPHNRRH